ncbi:uncharacterized protein LOC111050867 [Nilaparvata lugens]|uniref:uncharacterized protein LOC111050867 n=1 Tax=Nilaparvata lugens TaxID=108931 RepID=UPI00193E67E8|nr:uncharacterized protein LOC111050867 [Nilaparvata lugens]
MVMDYRNFIIFFGCLVLSNLQICSSISLKTLTNNEELSNEQVQATLMEIADVTKKVLARNTNLLLEKKEMKELLGENLEVLENHPYVKTSLTRHGGLQTSILYYLKKHPENAPLLQKAVDIWRKVIDDLLSKRNNDSPSKELHEKLVKSRSSSDNRIYHKITNEVLRSVDKKLEGEDYDELVAAVYIKIYIEYDIPTTSKLERVLFRKISTLYEDGVFDYVYDKLGGELAEFLFQVNSPP